MFCNLLLVLGFTEKKKKKIVVEEAEYYVPFFSRMYSIKQRIKVSILTLLMDLNHWINSKG